MRKISLSKKDKSINPKAQRLLIVLACVLVCVGIAVLVYLKNYHVYETTLVKPTCEANGYTESVCVICKTIERTHYTPALGHKFGEVKLKSKPTALQFGENYQQCERCKKKKTTRTEPTIDFKKLYFTGDAFTIDGNRVASGSLTYHYKGKKVTYFIDLAYLDNDNSRYIKHDYEISFFADKKHKQEVEVALIQGRPASHSWRLFGNYYDFNNARDAVVSDVYRQVRKTSKSIDKRLGETYVTVKQEPVLFFLNSGFVGVFRLTEVEGAQTLNVKKPETNCAIVRASYNSGQSFFRSKITNVGPWIVKYNSTDNDKWVYESLNNLQNFIVESDDKTFKKGISKYLDVDGMIDYMLVVYNTATADNVARGLTLATYDGKVWTPSFYDSNASFGLNNEGEITLLETVLAPQFKAGEEIEALPDTNSLLFERMLNCFYDEIKARYEVLKTTVFTAKNIQETFKKHINTAPKMAYDLEAEKYPFVDSKTDLNKFLEKFMAVRKNNLESFFKNEKTKPKTQQTQKETTLN